MKAVVVAGASGGHIFPALSLLATLHERHKGIQTMLVLPSLALNRHLDIQGSQLYYMPYVSFQTKSPRAILRAMVDFLRSFFKSAVLLARFQPDIVIGFGSVVSIPCILMARMLGIKTLLHEQNVIPGKANRFLARFSQRIAVSFAETRSYLTPFVNKVVHTGNPLAGHLIRYPKNEALDFFSLAHDTFTVLVMGGSQGSHTINRVFIESLKCIPAQCRLQVIHLAGSREYLQVQKQYEGMVFRNRVFEFLRSMQYAYSASDVVISRAGATSIAELIFFKLPCVLVPYPFAYQHQEANARVLEKSGGAIVLVEDKLTAVTLSQILRKLIENPSALETMRASYDSLAPSNASLSLAESAISMVHI